MYNIVLFGGRQSRIGCRQPPTATRLYRIVDVGPIEEARDPEGSLELAPLRVDLMDLFSEFMRQLGRVDYIARARYTMAKTPF